MRGSAFVKIRVWLVNRDGSINRQSGDIEYGHSEVGDMNTSYQREDAYRRAINQAIKQYRLSHRINSDTELNYHLLASGITTKREIQGKQVKKLNSIRISTKRKRELHKIIQLGKDKAITKRQAEREITEEQYRGKHIKELSLSQQEERPLIRLKHNKPISNIQEKYIIKTKRLKKSKK